MHVLSERKRFRGSIDSSTIYKYYNLSYSEVIKFSYELKSLNHMRYIEIKKICIFKVKE